MKYRITIFVFLTRYFIGIPPMRPGQRHLYRVNSTIPHTGLPLHPAVCLTCTVSPGMTSDDEGEHRTSSSNRQNGNRNEWHDHYETQTDRVDNKEHRKESPRKDKSKSKNVSSEFQHYIAASRFEGFYHHYFATQYYVVLG